ncbi:MAG TPA: thiamine phosphate synthase [Vicinamibacterales bacterium]|nr:thiamine phosphate synthase [Vicinamibacterales bacterium]
MFFPLYVILDTTLALERGHDPVDLARRFFDGGARLLQLRAKDAPSGQLLAWADAVCAAAASRGARVIVNDRADIARMAGAHGVHVGQEDLPPAAVREAAAGVPLAVGLSTHTAAQVAAAAREPVDYIAIGPVFGTGTKETGYEPVGLGMVEAAVRGSAGRPVVAIGGITLETAPSVIAAGATSVAVISDLLATGDPAARVRAYLTALGAP